MMHLFHFYSKNSDATFAERYKFWVWFLFMSIGSVSARHILEQEKQTLNDKTTQSKIWQSSDEKTMLKAH